MEIEPRPAKGIRYDEIHGLPFLYQTKSKWKTRTNKQYIYNTIMGKEMKDLMLVSVLEMLASPPTIRPGRKTIILLRRKLKRQDI